MGGWGFGELGECYVKSWCCVRLWYSGVDFMSLVWVFWLMMMLFCSIMIRLLLIIVERWWVIMMSV